MRFLITALVAVLLLPAVAFADGGAAALVQDCQDDKIDGTYSAKDYRDAQRRLPTDVDEYTTCRQTLRTAQLRAAAAGAPSVGGRVASRVAGAPGVAGLSTQPGSGTAGPGALGAGSGPRAASPGVAPAGAPRAPGAPGTSAQGAPGAPGAPSGAPGAPAPVGGADPGATPLVPVAVATGAGDDVPPTLALLLAVVGTGLLVAAGIARRQRRA